MPYGWDSDMSLLDKQRALASPTYSRWLAPPAALCVHLCIGEVYAFSVFNLPLTRLVGVTHQAPGDWRLTTLSWIFSIAIFVLGVSAWTCGLWLERVGPRKAMFTAACCFGGGFIVSAIGVWIHDVWLLYLGYGLLGGIGLGIGYISPVAMLIKWFPDRPGMATGLAIMGFGGGAMIGAPLSIGLMRHFASATSAGVGKTFIVMGILYFCFMSIGALMARLPREGWLPAGYAGGKNAAKPMHDAHMHPKEAVKTPQFYLLWMVLFLSVAAGIGVLSQASAIAQQMFPKVITEDCAAGFVGLLSISNMGGRFFWATLSDYLGRKTTYVLLFASGAALCAAMPGIGSAGNVVLFILAYCAMIGACGGGFSTAPAYVSDVFGPAHVGAIHGRLMTAVSAAGVLGPMLVNYLHEYQIHAGVPAVHAYTLSMYVMAALLAVGLMCNLQVSAVNGTRSGSVAPPLRGRRTPSTP